MKKLALLLVLLFLALPAYAKKKSPTCSPAFPNGLSGKLLFRHYVIYKYSDSDDLFSGIPDHTSMWLKGELSGDAGKPGLDLRPAVDYGPNDLWVTINLYKRGSRTYWADIWVSGMRQPGWLFHAVTPEIEENSNGVDTIQGIAKTFHRFVANGWSCK